MMLKKKENELNKIINEQNELISEKNVESDSYKKQIINLKYLNKQ